MNYEYIPNELKSIPNWVCWRAIPDSNSHSGTLNNMFTFTDYTGYDPEVSATSSALTPGIDNSSYPRSKSWVLGVNLTF